MVRFFNKHFRPKKEQVRHPKDLILPLEKQIKADRLESQGKYMEALAIYENFLKGYPGSIQVLNNAATMYIRMKIPAKAYGLLEKAIKLDPRYVKAWNNLATVKMMFGDVVGATQTYQKVLGLDPQNGTARKGLQQAQIIEKRISKARVTGGIVQIGGTYFSDRNAVLVCAKCRQRYIEFGQWSASNKTLGGALCRNCGEFYCEECVSQTVLGGHKGKQFSCRCRKSKVWVGDDGQVAMDNLEELVVFHAESIPYVNSLKVHSKMEQSQWDRSRTSAKQAIPKMKGSLGARYGSQRECLSKCTKCDRQIVFLLPDKPIPGRLAQMVLKYECGGCGQVLYATTCITGQAVLAARCSIVNDQMSFENPKALEIEDAGDVRFSGDRLHAIAHLVVGTGKDGRPALLRPEDLQTD